MLMTMLAILFHFSHLCCFKSLLKWSNTFIYKLFFRNTYVGIEKSTGLIHVTRCTCEQNAAGKCAHVGALCYLLEHFKLNPNSVIIQKSSTSKLQLWGQGQKTKKNPGPIHMKDYNKKINSKLITIDPRPVIFRNKKSNVEMSWYSLLRFEAAFPVGHAAEVWYVAEVCLLLFYCDCCCLLLWLCALDTTRQWC